MLPMLAMGAMAFGGSLLQGMGAKQASAKQGRMQMIADALARQENERIMNEVNAKREQMGAALIAASDPRVAVAEAEAAGFNPVTWLSAGYGARLGALSDAYRMMDPAYTVAQASQIPQQHSMLSAFGGALSAAGSAMGTQYRADQSYDLQMGKMVMGLSNSFGFGSGGGYAPSGVSYGTASGGGNPAGGNGALSSLPYPNAWKRGDVDVTNPWFGAAVAKTYADAEAFEARYGDIAQEIAGARNAVVDTYHNATGGRDLGTDIADAWKGSSDPWSFAATPAGKMWNWMWNGGSSGYKGSTQPYLPFPGAGQGITYAY